ncbi:MAG: SDR family NAD(P)-dependent oxidoreductase [Gemmatimonadota bacterium]
MSGARGALDGRLAGRGAVVTGGGRGIGAAVARELAGAGAAVVVAARTEEEIERVAAELRERGDVAAAVRCDVTDPASVRSLAGEAAELVGRVEILVNSHGVAGSAPVTGLTLEEWNRTLAVNATGTFLVLRAFLPRMVERGRGRIVNVASVAGLGGAPYIAAYAASKHAVVGLTRCAAAEVEGTGVTVNAVCPGYVDTEMTRESVRRIVRKTGRTEEEAREAILRAAGQSRLLSPAEVARAVLALCGEEGGRTNGEAIVMGDGSAAGPDGGVAPDE